MSIRKRIAELRSEAATVAQEALKRMIRMLEERAVAEIESGNLVEAVDVLERLARLSGALERHTASSPRNTRD